MQQGDKILYLTIAGKKRRICGHISEKNSRGSNATNQRRQIVFVALNDIYNQPMVAQTLKQPLNLAVGFWYPMSQASVLITIGVELNAQQQLENTQIIACE